MVRTFPTIPGNYQESLPRNTNSLQQRCSLSSSPPIRTPQQQNIRPFSSSEDAAGIQSHRKSFEPIVAELLQSSVSGPQARRVLPSNHRPQEIEPLLRGTIVQDGDTVLYHSGSSASGMDHQGCLPSYLGPSEHQEVLPLHYRQEDLTIPSITIWSFDGTKRIHQNLGPISTVTQNQRHQRHQSPLLSLTIFDWIIRADTPEHCIQHTQETIQLLISLGWTINWKKSILEPSRILDFLGLHFNLEQAIVSPPNSFIETLTNILSRLLPLTVMSACKVTSINSMISHYAPFMHHRRLQLCFLQFWIKTCWSQHSQHWDSQMQLDEEYLSHL